MILTPEPDTPAAPDSQDPVTSTDAPVAVARDLDVTPSPASDNATAGDDTAGVVGLASSALRGHALIGLGALVAGVAVLV